MNNFPTKHLAILAVPDDSAFDHNSERNMDNLITIIGDLTGIHLQLLTIYSFIAIALLGFTFSERFENINVSSKVLLTITFLALSAIALASTLRVTEPYNIAVQELRSSTTKSALSKTNVSKDDKNSANTINHNSLNRVANALKEKQWYWMVLYYLTWTILSLLFVWKKEFATIKNKGKT